MSASTTNKADSIRFNSGNLVLFKSGSEWKGLGHAVSGKLSLKTDKNALTLMDGETVQKPGKRECSLQIVLAQVDETIQDLIFGLVGKSVPIYVYNGVENGKYQEYYFPRGEVLATFDIDMKGQAHQALALDILINPADTGNAAIPIAGLPDEAKAPVTTATTGSNPYYVVVDTAVTP